ncbi:tyrosine-type recombinase/integrase [Vibrio sp. SCSIO 43137]|uniref:tyrosine-type recombinase/integrase n=1 Tax=Vibrio sp. SCSIO 43137 TaxID=3021011 RepID=UPI0023077249|nr:site-specific integrase [Vibrio sp. SCSIO 43137]WCE30472.1 site-specific integrase [Vibrio sp. SCSIO 43137]
MLVPRLESSNTSSSLKRTKIIVDPNGSIVYPHSLYLVSKLRGEGKVKDTSSIAKALLLFARFLSSTHTHQQDKDGNEIPAEFLTYKTLSKYEEESAVWRFAEFLKQNCRHSQSNGEEAWSSSTVKTYIGAVLGFYKWMQENCYLKNDRNNVVTHYTDAKVLDPYQDADKHDMLTHLISKQKRHYTTSNVMGMFPRSDSTPTYKKLKPMTTEDLSIYLQHIEQLPRPLSLMFKLSIETGIRIQEVTHFPVKQVGEVDLSELDVVPIYLVHTKGSKPRTIEVPLYLYEELEQYKYSKVRKANAEKRETNNSCKASHEYLFLSNRGKPYSENTLEKHFAAIRKAIQKVTPSWYYRIHDCRSTYATNWLWTE